ncbi:unnamed protein product [Cylindrotheca closterium]|uniref:Uncharacterized protein n=1 Tax=Cylindrotheca closterium TaxID=2856 RepID=A0AAD2G082_9STRA|nr:unnamed protein product [Cylindrotheca closterium]
MQQHNGRHKPYVTESSLNVDSEADIELSVPFVEAAPIADGEAVTPPRQGMPAPPSTVVRVQVTAPAMLPPGYVMQVLYQEKDETGNFKDTWKKGIIIIPLDGGGVNKGQVFEAETQPFDTVKQIHGYWHGNEFNVDECCCSQTTDADFCLLSWYCPPVAWACLYEQLVILDKQNAGQNSYRPRFVAKSIGFVSLLFLILSIVPKTSGAVLSRVTPDDSGFKGPFAVVFFGAWNIWAYYSSCFCLLGFWNGCEIKDS